MILFIKFVTFLSSFKVVNLFKEKNLKFVIYRANSLKFFSLFDQILGRVVCNGIHVGHKLLFVIIFEVDSVCGLLQHCSKVVEVMLLKSLADELFVNRRVQSLNCVNIVGCGCDIFHFQQFLINFLKFFFVSFDHDFTC